MNLKSIILSKKSQRSPFKLSFSEADSFCLPNLTVLSSRDTVPATTFLMLMVKELYMFVLGAKTQQGKRSRYKY